MTNPAQTLTAVPAAELDDHTLRRELAAGHQLQQIVNERGNPREVDLLRLRMAELDGEYLRRFPLAAQSWPWPLPKGFRPVAECAEPAETLRRPISSSA